MTVKELEPKDWHMLEAIPELPEHTRVLGFFEGDDLAGYVHIVIAPLIEEPYFKPEYRGTGIAGRAHKEVEEFVGKVLKFHRIMAQPVHPEHWTYLARLGYHPWKVTWCRDNDHIFEVNHGQEQDRNHE